MNRVREERAIYVIERGGEPVAQIGPVDRKRSTMADFKAWIRTAPHVDEEYLRGVEAGARRLNKPRARRNPWER